MNLDLKAQDSTVCLLSPAGNWDCARAAVVAGADAIFFGLPEFNARLRADNFTHDDLPELMRFLHEHGVKGYVTMNTLIFTNELEAAEKQLRWIAECKVDALIIQDLGLAHLARKIIPQVELHASTQMTITAPEGLAFLEQLFSLDCAVLSRELTLNEIERFRGKSEVPLEVFVHGALCVAYSGQCLTSESLGKRSANRGECAQACRMPYDLIVDGVHRDLGEHRYLLSPQDLAAVDMIPQLIQAGVKSFKIEGRLKSPEYVAAVTRVYRKAIDHYFGKNTAVEAIQAQDRYELEMTFSRGLTTGWLAGANHPYLTHGRYGKKRGPYLGKIEQCGHGWVELEQYPDEVGLKPGDGVVFDAGENRDLEQGARVWKLEGKRILFHRVYSGINFERIKTGHGIYKTSDPQLESEIKKFWQNTKLVGIKNSLHLIVRGEVNQPLILETTSSDGKIIQAKSEDVLIPAQKRAITTELLNEQLGKLGDTPYELASIDNQLVGDLFLTIAQINEARRNLVDQLDRSVFISQEKVPVSADVSYKNYLPQWNENSASDTTSELRILCRNEEQVEACLSQNISKIYCDFEDPRRYQEAVALCRKHQGVKVYLATPRIVKTGEIGYLKMIQRYLPDGLLLRNLAALDYFKDDASIEKIIDFSLNIANPITAQLLKEHAHADLLTISYDLNISQVLDLLKQAPANWFELTLHQHMPMFHMEHCVFCVFLSEGTSYKDCGRPCEKHVVHLRDRIGQMHRLQADVGCRNTVFNGRAQTGSGYLDALQQAGLRHFRIELLDHTQMEAKQLIQAYQAYLSKAITLEELLVAVRAQEKLGVTIGTLSVE